VGCDGVGATVFEQTSEEAMMYYWIRRGYGAFVRVKNETKGRARAKHWHETNTGGDSSDAYRHVIGLFKGTTKFPHEATREALYGGR
jgi:hypothetical protein